MVGFYGKHSKQVKMMCFQIYLNKAAISYLNIFIKKMNVNIRSSISKTHNKLLQKVAFPRNCPLKPEMPIKMRNSSR